MEANELMSGDWVKISYNGEVGQVYRIDMANGKGNEYAAVNGGDRSCENLVPIPLTAEMLDKNGFERRKETRVDCYDLRQDKASVYLEIKDRIEHEWLCVIGRHYPTSWRCRLELRVHEVHELQHALRLAGIKKEIVL